MKVLIQDERSDRYLATGGTWTARARDAKDFQSKPYACAIAEREMIFRLRVVLYFEEFDYTIKARTFRGHEGQVNSRAFGC